MRARPMRIWITRARPGAEATAARLRDLGHAPLVAPLLRVRPLEGVALDLQGVGALAFTSANAVTAFAALTAARALPVFAVGEATAEAARTAGFAAVAAADGDVHTLARHIIARGAPDSVVLHPGAEEPAADLAALLTAAGVHARGVAVYRTEAVDALPRAVIAALPDAVLLHSPKAARTLAALLPPAWGPGLDAFALSPACAAPLVDFGLRRLEAARDPNEAARLTLLTL